MKLVVALVCLGLLGVFGFSIRAAPQSGSGQGVDVLETYVPEIHERAPDGTMHSFAVYRSASGAPAMFVGRAAYIQDIAEERLIGLNITRTQASIVDLAGGAPMRAQGVGYDLVVRPKSGDWRSVAERSDLSFEFVPRNP